MPHPNDQPDDPMPTRLVGLCNSHPSMQQGEVMGRLLGEFPGGWHLIEQHLSSSEDFSRYDIQQHLHQFQADWDQDCLIPYEWVGTVERDEMTARYPAAPFPGPHPDDVEVEG